MKYLLNRPLLSFPNTQSPHDSGGDGNPDMSKDPVIARARSARSNLFLIFLVSVLWLLVTAPAGADIPHLINYQGKLVDEDGNPIEDPKTVRFKFYTTASGGLPIWEEEQSVDATKGVFNVLLGNGSLIQGKPLSDLDFDRQYYLALQVVGDEEMTPRQQIASAAYAFKAKVAETIDPGGDGSNLNADMV